MEETSKIEEVPANAPWKLDWKVVAKAAGTYAEPPDKDRTYVQTVLADNTKPWLIDWGRYAQEQPRKPTMAPSSFLKEPAIPAQGKAKQTAPMASYGGYDFESVVKNLIQAESRGKHTDKGGRLTTSPVGAKGITQVMRKTGEDPGYGVAPLKDESENEYIRFGRDYLKAMLDEFGGDYRKALAAYNYGPGSVKKAISYAAKQGDDWLKHTPTETKDYVSKILTGSTLPKKEKLEISSEVMDTGKPNDYWTWRGTPNKEMIMSHPKVRFKDVVSAGIDSKVGRTSYEGSMQKELERVRSELKGDDLKYYTKDWKKYAEAKNPALYQSYTFFDKQKGEIPSRLRDKLLEGNPEISFEARAPEMSTVGFVVNNQERIHITDSGDFNTLAHEYDHSRTNRDTLKNSGVNSVAVSMARNMLSDDEELDFKSLLREDILFNLTSNSPIRELAMLASKNKEDTDFKSVWRAANAFDNTGEFIANFAGYMDNIPEGKSWSDTPFYKKLVTKVGEKKAQGMILATVTAIARQHLKGVKE